MRDASDGASLDLCLDSMAAGAAALQLFGPRAFIFVSVFVCNISPVILTFSFFFFVLCCVVFALYVSVHVAVQEVIKKKKQTRQKRNPDMKKPIKIFKKKDF